MKTSMWKILVVVISFLILFTFAIQQGDHSYNVPYIGTNYHGHNGSVLVIAALNNVNANGKIEMIYTYDGPGSTVVTFQNGTNIAFNSTLNLTFHLGKQVSRVESVYMGGPLNLSLTPEKPMDSGMLYNVSLNYFLNYLPLYLSTTGVNYYFVYIAGYSAITVSMESEVL